MESNKKITRYRRISFALTMLVVGLWVTFGLVYIATSGPDVIFGEDAGTGGFTLLFGIFVLAILTFLIIPVAIALRKKDLKPGLATSGLVIINFVCLGLSFLLFLWVVSIFTY